jgi:hypothetical protein
MVVIITHSPLMRSDAVQYVFQRVLKCLSLCAARAESDDRVVVVDSVALIALGKHVSATRVLHVPGAW